MDLSSTELIHLQFGHLEVSRLLVLPSEASLRRWKNSHTPVLALVVRTRILFHRH